MLAGSLAFFIEFIATKSGKVFQAVFIGAAVFLIGKYLTSMENLFFHSKLLSLFFIYIVSLFHSFLNSTGTAATYMRFFPYIKKNYDYGVVIFLLTFNLITVSSYRVENVLMIAHDRFYTIAIGCAICLFTSLLVFPMWSGEDLHNSTVGKLEGLAKSIEGIQI